jgi:hypothetical protein
MPQWDTRRRRPLPPVLLPLLQSQFAYLLGRDHSRESRSPVWLTCGRLIHEVAI